MRGAKSAKWVAIAAVVALGATACGGGGDLPRVGSQRVLFNVPYDRVRRSCSRHDWIVGHRTVLLATFISTTARRSRPRSSK